MKTPILLTLAAAVAALTLTATAGEALLSPRAKDTQIKTVPTVSEPAATFNQSAAVSPRALGNQPTKVAGTSNDANTLVCPRHMAGSPKAIGACVEHPGAPMSCCSSVAGAK